MTLRVESPDGEDGFPGNLAMEMTYTLTADNGVRIEYRGTTDQMKAYIGKDTKARCKKQESRAKNSCNIL